MDEMRFLQSKNTDNELIIKALQEIDAKNQLKIDRIESLLLQKELEISNLRNQVSSYQVSLLRKIRIEINLAFTPLKRDGFKIFMYRSIW